MQISELADRTGVSVHALRHYDRLGMLKPARRASGYREYTEAMLREAIFIAMSRKMGFSLKAIALQLPAYRAGRLTFKQMMEAMQARVAEIDQQTQTLQALRSEVMSHIAWMKKQQRADDAQKARHLAAPQSGQRKPVWPTVKARAMPPPPSSLSSPPSSPPPAASRKKATP